MPLFYGPRVSGLGASTFTQPLGDSEGSYNFRRGGCCEAEVLENLKVLKHLNNSTSQQSFRKGYSRAILTEPCKCITLGYNLGTLEFLNLFQAVGLTWLRGSLPKCLEMF